MSDQTPITAIVTWAARSAPDVPAAHRYRGRVNLPGVSATEVEVEIGRPAREVWHPDQLVHPLRVNDRIHGVLVGQYMQWDYVERPKIRGCEDTEPSTPTFPIPGDGNGDETPIVVPRPLSPSGPMPATAPSMFWTKMLATISATQLAALGKAISNAIPSVVFSGRDKQKARQSMKLGPFKLFANETQDTVWFKLDDGTLPDLSEKIVTIQVVGPNTWATAVYKLVGRVDERCPAIDVPEATTITASTPYIVQVSVSSFAEIGLKNTTVEGSTIELFAYVSIGE